MNINNTSPKGKDVMEEWWEVRRRSQANSEGVLVDGTCTGLVKNAQGQKGHAGWQSSKP